MPVLAGIDVGTNTVRLLIADVSSSGGESTLVPIVSRQRIPRLGEGIQKTGSLSSGAVDRVIAVLREFAGEIRRHSVKGTVAVATSAVREAKNRKEFLALALRETGLTIEVISGKEEARRTCRGVAFGLKGQVKRMVVLDIGGGSTEFIKARGKEIQKVITIPLGVVKLREQYLVADPPSQKELSSLVGFIEREIATVRPRLASLKGYQLIGTAGTVTTLAAIAQGLTAYDPASVQGFRMTATQVEDIYKKLTSMPLLERTKIPVMEKGREDVIVAGTAILVSLMRQWELPSLLVSDYGLREGILLDWMEKPHSHE